MHANFIRLYCFFFSMHFHLNLLLASPEPINNLAECVICMLQTATKMKETVEVEEMEVSLERR